MLDYTLSNGAHLPCPSRKFSFSKKTFISFPRFPHPQNPPPPLKAEQPRNSQPWPPSKTSPSSLNGLMMATDSPSSNHDSPWLWLVWQIACPQPTTKFPPLSQERPSHWRCAPTSPPLKCQNREFRFLPFQLHPPLWPQVRSPNHSSQSPCPLGPPWPLLPLSSPRILSSFSSNVPQPCSGFGIRVLLYLLGAPWTHCHMVGFLTLTTQFPKCPCPDYWCHQCWTKS